MLIGAMEYQYPSEYRCRRVLVLLAFACPHTEELHFILCIVKLSHPERVSELLVVINCNLIVRQPLRAKRLGVDCSALFGLLLCRFDQKPYDR